MSSPKKTRQVGQIPRREFIKATATFALSATLPELGQADPTARSVATLFPTDLPNKQWLQFRARGFRKPACGVIYRLGDKVTNGMAEGWWSECSELRGGEAGPGADL